MSVSITKTLTATTIKTFHISSPAGASFNLKEEGVNVYVAEIYRVHNRFLAVEAMNVNGADVVYFTVNGTDPAIGADDNYVLAALAGDSVIIDIGSTESFDVKCISAGTPTVFVRGI